jgi:glycosyltransferase involved in cell wall biosynthesis
VKISGGKNQSSSWSVRLDRIIFFLISFFFLNINCFQPKISILTSVFAGNNFIAQFLADITNQTIFDQCELILINANPLGESLEENIINIYCAKFPEQIVYLRLTADPGLYAVWNMGANLARGKYLTNANLDDRLSPNCYQIHSQELDDNLDVDLVYSNSYITKLPNETFVVNSQVGMINHVEFTRDAIKKANLPSFNPMWRKSLHEQYGYFDESFKIAGDWEFWVRIVAGGAKFKKIPGVLGLFYYNTIGLSQNKKNLMRQRLERSLVRQKHAEFFKKI